MIHRSSVQLTFFMVVGILIAYYFAPHTGYVAGLLLFFFTVLLVAYFYSFRVFKQKYYFKSIACILFFFLGMATLSLHRQKEIPDGLHVSTAQCKTVFEITKILKDNSFYSNYIAKVISVADTVVKGKIVLHVKKDTAATIALGVDDVVCAAVNFKAVKSPINPYQFDYRRYLEKQHIFYEAYTDYDKLLLLNSEVRTLRGAAFFVRDNIVKALGKYHFEPEALAVIKALFLGQRRDISKALVRDYSRAGIIHILAISGLHVGIVLWILHVLLRPIERLRRGKYVKLSIVLLFLWFYAVVTGLSPSVVRAATMGSFVMVALQSGRMTSVYDTLAASFFVLLLIDPYYLFDTGFQLSYAAVFSIVWIQPLLVTLWEPKYRFVFYLWELITVSIAAQLGVMPLTLYYFHQFSGLFLVSNLLVIPFLGILLMIGFITIALALLGIFLQFFANLFEYCILYLNALTRWIARQDAFFFKDISFDFFGMFTLYCTIFFTILFFKKRKSVYLIPVLSAVLSMQGWALYQKIQIGKSNEFVIFHKTKHSLIGDSRKRMLTVYHTMSGEVLETRTVSDYITGSNVSDVRYVHMDSIRLKNIFHVNAYLLIVDKDAVYRLKDLKKPKVLLRGSPKINLERLIDTLYPKQIIADGSNYSYLVKRWKESCLQQKIPFHYTGEQGAYVLPY